MTMRTRTYLRCECGHEGVYRTSENDQPYSEMWESHSLEGFQGGGEDGSDRTTMICPKCGQVGKVSVTGRD